jgi:hypothetical protein
MKSIDFLPDIYRQRDALRRARLWWGAVGLMFGGAIGASATAQLWLRHGLERELRELAPQYAAAQAQVQELTSLQTQILRAGHEANLYTYLDHPGPRTQLLAEVVRPLPDCMRLTQMHVGEEEQARQTTAAGPRTTRPDEQTPQASHPELDLLRLQDELDRRQATVELDGHTGDVSRLHAYVAEVNRSPIIAQAHIKSLEAAAGNQSGRTRFTLRLIVRPGHCQASEAAGAPAPASFATGAAPPAPLLPGGGG